VTKPDYDGTKPTDDSVDNLDNAGVNGGADSGKPGVPDNFQKSADGSDGNVDWDSKLKDIRKEYQSQIDEMKRFIGQQADEIGELRGQTREKIKVEDFVGALEDGWSSENPVTRWETVGNLVNDIALVERNKELDAMRNHYKVSQKNPAYKDISYQDVVYYAAINDINLFDGKNNGVRGIDRIMNSIVQSRKSDVDLNAEVEKRAKHLLEEWKSKQHPANKSTSSGTEGKPAGTDDKSFDINKLVASGIARSRGIISSK